MRRMKGAAMAAGMMIWAASVPGIDAASQTQPGQATKAAQTAKTAPGQSLEGSRWKVMVTPDEAAAAKGEKAFEDEMVFTGGKVTMTACVPYGFAPSDYKSDKAGEGWSFETTQASESSGTSEWKAKMTGDAVKGTLTWKKGKGEVYHYTFEGKKIPG